MAERKDPFRNFRFKLEIDSIVQAGFSQATIGDITQDPIEYREGDEPPTARKIPGLVKHSNLTLKSGTTDSRDLYEWRKKVEEGNMKLARRNIAVILNDADGTPKARWEFENCWPSKYHAPDLDAKGNDVAIESLEIVHEGMKRVS